MGSKIWGSKKGFFVTLAVDPSENPMGVFPRANSLTLVVDRSCVSSNFMG